MSASDLIILAIVVVLVAAALLYIRKSKKLSEDKINEMETLAIDLLNMLELYKQDKYYDDF